MRIRSMWRSAVLVGVLILMPLEKAYAAESFVGRWAIKPVACSSYGDTAETAPLIATSTSVQWFVASCQIGKMYKIGRAVHIQARCSAEGKVNSTPITLEARGDRMRVTWDGVKVEDMKRCK
jgi:hypothetical protein